MTVTAEARAGPADGGADLVVLPPLCPLRISAIDFRHAQQLYRRAHASSSAWVDSGAASLPRPERILSLHGHPSSPAQPAVREQ